MELRDLRFFVAVGEELHFARAAARLHIVPAAVSQRIRDLETELGLALFERTSRKVRLTDAGAQLLAPARAVLTEVDGLASLARSLASGASGRVLLGFSPNAGPFASLAIEAIRDAHPDIQILGRSMWSHEALAAIGTGELDAAVVRGPVSAAGIGRVGVGEYADDHLAVAAGDRLASRGRISVADLHGRPLLVVERKLASMVHDGTVDFLTAQGVTPLWRFHEIQDFEQLMTLVAAGEGATLVHSHHAGTAYRGVVVLPLDEAGPRYPMELVWREGGDSPVIRALRGYAEHMPFA